MAADVELLHAYATAGAQEAFTQFVERHLNLVYFAALRRTNGNTAMAEEVSQAVFTQAARQAKALAGHSSLTGWLYTATRNAAAKAMRSENTRRRHEHDAAMHELTTAAPAQQWELLRPVIDEALDSLDARDREAILVRFFEGRPFAEVGATLRISQDAARMRVDRALDKLRLTLERRGIRSASAALATVLATQGGLALPAGLVATISGAAMPATAASVGAAATLLGFMTATKITLGAVSIAAFLASALLMMERNRVQQAEKTLATVSKERAALQTQLTRTRTALQAAEIRAAEAERDTDMLLQALPMAIAKKPAAPAKAPDVATRTPLQGASLMEEYKKLLYQLWDPEVERRAKTAAEVRYLNPESAFKIKINAVEGDVASGAFLMAKRRLAEAIVERGVHVPLPESVEKLRAVIEAETVRVEMTFVSDEETLVAISSPGFLRILPPYENQTEPVPPGNHNVIGRRRGYQDVVLPIQVRKGVPPPTVNVFCTVPIRP